jgi:hypothetical protein
VVPSLSTAGRCKLRQRRPYRQTTRLLMAAGKLLLLGWLAGLIACSEYAILGSVCVDRLGNRRFKQFLGRHRTAPNRVSKATFSPRCARRLMARGPMKLVPPSTNIDICPSSYRRASGLTPATPGVISRPVVEKPLPVKGQGSLPPHHRGLPCSEGSVMGTSLTVNGYLGAQDVCRRVREPSWISRVMARPGFDLPGV